MSQRTFKYYTINTTNTPQPLLGTWLTTTIATPVSIDQVISLIVNDTTPFQKGDPFIIQTTTGTNVERGAVVAVTDGTHMTVKGLVSAHTGGIFGTGEFISLGQMTNSIYVQALDGNAGNLFIGLAPNFVVATGVNMLLKMVKVAATVQPIEFATTRSGLANVDSIGQLFITGTSADSYLPSFAQV